MAPQSGNPVHTTADCDYSTDRGENRNARIRRNGHENRPAENHGSSC